MVNSFKGLAKPVNGWVERRYRGISVFWRRLGGMPSFEGLTVMDFGCGDGHMGFTLAEQGAKKVVALDINRGCIQEADCRLTREFPHLDGILEFRCESLPALGERFDAIVSRDAFEHIIGLETLWERLISVLNPGGRLYLGFGPLWNSPFGGHRRMKLFFPWTHVFLPEAWLLKWVNRHRNEPVASVAELGLNRFSLKAYQDLFMDSRLEVILWKVNHGDIPLSRLFSHLCRIPFLGEYFSHDIYAVFEKKDA